MCSHSRIALFVARGFLRPPQTTLCAQKAAGLSVSGFWIFYCFEIF